MSCCGVLSWIFEPCWSIMKAFFSCEDKLNEGRSHFYRRYQQLFIRERGIEGFAFKHALSLCVVFPSRGGLVEKQVLIHVMRHWRTWPPKAKKRSCLLSSLKSKAETRVLSAARSVHKFQIKMSKTGQKRKMELLPNFCGLMSSEKPLFCNKTRPT